MDLAALERCPRPRRVAIVGCCGAGKSTLAARLASVLELPLVHLDREYWLPGWVEPSQAAWDIRHDELVAAESWLIDGNYGRTMDARLDRAELVVLVHAATPIALWRVITRTIRDHGRSRPDMAAGCAEQLLRRGTWHFWWYVLRFNGRNLPRIRARLAERAADRVVVVASRRNARDLIARASARR